MKIEKQKNNIKFGSHLSKKFLNIIADTDPKKVEKMLYEIGIDANFYGNKTIAACTLQAVEIFKNLNLSLPKKVVAQKIFYSNTTSPVNGMANTKGFIAFNPDMFYDIKHFDKINNIGRKEKLVSTSHFLSTFIHEFIHHDNFEFIKKNQKLIDIAPLIKEIKKFDVNLDLENYVIKKYDYYPNRKYLELFAEIMTNKIAKSLDNKSFIPKYNPYNDIINSSNINSKKEKNFNEVLKIIYTGDFKNLKKIFIK